MQKRPISKKPVPDAKKHETNALKDTFAAEPPCSFTVIPSLTAQMLGHRVLSQARFLLSGARHAN